MCGKCLVCKIIKQDAATRSQSVLKMAKDYLRGKMKSGFENIVKSEPWNGHPDGIFVPCGEIAHKFLYRIVSQKEI